MPLSFQLRKAFLNSEAHRSPPLLAQPFICSKRPPLPSTAANTPPNRFKTNSCSGSCERIYSPKPERWPAPSRRYLTISILRFHPLCFLLEALQVHWPIFKVSSCNFSPVAQAAHSQPGCPPHLRRSPAYMCVGLCKCEGCA